MKNRTASCMSLLPRSSGCTPQGAIAEAQAVYTSETTADLEKVQGLLRKTVDIAKENILSEEQMLDECDADAAHRLRRQHCRHSASGSSSGFIITKSITRPLKKSVDFTRAVAGRRPE